MAKRSPGSEVPLAYLIIPPATATRDVSALESTIQALALPGPARTRALALELVGAPTARAFVVRGATAEAVSNAAMQLRAQYPQAELRPLPPEEDPLRLAPDEAVSVRELRFVGEAFLSLRTWTPRPTAHPQEGADPLLGLLAALGQLPEGHRAVAQLALLPAPETWSHGYERQADRASLERTRLDYGLRERERMQVDMLRDTMGFPLPLIILGLLGSLGWLVWRRLQEGERGRFPWIPRPIWQALTATLHGQMGTAEVIVLALVGGLLLLLGMVAIRRLLTLPPFAWLRRSTRVYDPDRITAKTEQPAYRARLRLFVIGRAGQTPEQRRESRALHVLALDRLAAAYRQFHLAGGAHFASATLLPRKAQRLLPLAPTATESERRRTAWTRDLARSADLLSLSEVATLWHLPQACDVTDLAWLRDEERARTILAPPALALRPGEQQMEQGSALLAASEAQPGEQRHRPSVQITMAAHSSPPHIRPVLGCSRHAGQEVLVQAPPDLLTRHTLAVAKTGKGKSTLLLLLAGLALAGGATPDALRSPGELLRSALPSPGPEERVTEAPGLMLLDPHGDLAQAFLGLIPPERRDDVVIIDLADTAYPIGLNPLDVTLGRERDKAVENLLLIFSHIWTRFWGPRMENALEFALKTLYEANRYLVEQDPQQGPDVQFTLLDVAPVLSIPSFRHRLLSHVRDPSLLAWWAQYFEPLDLRMQLEIINPVLTKLAKFSSSQVARRIVGQGRSTLDLARVVNDGQVLLVNTARGHVGADTAALVGATLLGLLRVTLEEQSRRGTGARRRVAVLVDEFQLMPGVDYGAMLAELRKFGASFVLATQALAQLDAVDRALRPTVLSNIDNLFAFAVSAEDARLLVRELDEVVTERDLINVPTLAAYAKLTLGGRRLPVFSVGLEPPLPGDAELRQALVQASRARIARPAAAVDALLEELAARHTPPRNLDTWVRAAAREATREVAAVSARASAATTTLSTSGVTNSAGSVDTEAGGVTTGRSRRSAGRRRVAADPLAIVGIPTRRRSARTAPFDFAPRPASDMDADLRPMAAVASSANTLVTPPGMSPMELPWPAEDEIRTGDEDSAAQHEEVDTEGAGNSGASKPKKRQRGSRGGAGRKAKAAIEPGGDSAAGDDPIRPMEQRGELADQGEAGGTAAAGLRKNGQNDVAEGGRKDG